MVIALAARDMERTTRTLDPRWAPRSWLIHAIPHRHPKLAPRYPPSFAATPDPSAPTAPEDVTHEVALKAIPKKGNEESMWSEMWVLQCLDHLNILGPISSPP